MFLVAEYLSPKKLNLSNYCTITYNNNTEIIIMYMNKYMYMCIRPKRLKVTYSTGLLRVVFNSEVSVLTRLYRTETCEMPSTGSDQIRRVLVLVEFYEPNARMLRAFS